MTRSEVSATAMSAIVAIPMNALSRGCRRLVPVAENKAKSIDANHNASSDTVITLREIMVFLSRCFR